MGWLEGSTRLMPGIETTLFGHTIAWNLLIPSMVIPGAVVTAMILYPFIEAWATGDRREHHLLDRPRNAPVRTALGVMAITFYGLLCLGGGNDIIATQFGVSLNAVTYVLRVLVFVAPVLAFIFARRVCIGLQRADQERLLHGAETGIIVRDPSGSYEEKHAALAIDEAYTLTQHVEPLPIEAGLGTDAGGVAATGGAKEKLRVKASSFYFSHNVRKPTRAELEEAAHHNGNGHNEIEAGSDEEVQQPRGH